MITNMFDSTISVLLVSAVSVLWIVLYVMPRPRMSSLTSTIPGPPSLPLLGNCLSCMGNVDIFALILSWYDTYGDIYKFWLGPRLHVMICNPEDARCVLSNNKIKNRDQIYSKIGSYFIGNGILTSKDEVWRRHRKIVNTSFQYNTVMQYWKIFQKKANILSDKLEDIADGRITEIRPMIELCMLDAICETAIGVEMNTQSKGYSAIGTALEQCMKMGLNRLYCPWLYFDPIYRLTSEGRKSRDVIQTVKRFSNEVITTKLKAFHSRKLESNKETNSDKEIKSFLDDIIKASDEGGEILSPVEIQDEVTVIIGAGSETVTTSTAYTLVLLGMHPEHQARINQELADVFGDSDREATIEDVKKMNYLEYCIKESLRLFPVVTLMPRDVPEDVELSNGRVLPAGSTTFVFSWPIHRSAKNYVNPNSFWPDRWAPENSVGRHPFAYFPFAAGPRMCVGYKYAMLIMQTVLTTLLRRYRVGCSSHTMEQLEQNIGVGITISSLVGHKIQLFKKV